MFLTDSDGRIQTWNSGAQRLLGYDALQVLGQPTSMLYTDADRNSSQFGLALRAAHDKGHIQFNGWRQRADGTTFWAQVTSTALRDSAGACYGFVQVIRDLTDANRVETLETEGRRTAEFIAMLSHELRNPLAPIRNAATLLKRFADNKETSTWCAELIDRQVNHLTRIVDDLLDVSRVTSGKIRIAKEACELSTIVQEAVESMRPLLATRQHTLTLDIVPAPVPVLGDSIRLSQVVVNLLNNAAKYTPEPGIVAVSLHREGDEATLTVSDTGMGLSPALAEKVFEPFVQGERALARSEGGLGVGLTLVKSVVQLHGGSVSVKSSGEGLGSAFTVKLPLGALAPKLQQVAPTAVKPARSLRVLVVDDNVDAAEAVAVMLRLDGHQVEVANDGVQGLEAAKRQVPDVAILDIGLPGLDGYELAHRISTTEGLEQVKLIALTGYGQERDIAAATAAGFAHHLTKPARPGELAKLLVS
jgi:PAS domain S-box-containing protein